MFNQLNMNILLKFSGFILSFIVVLFYERKIRNLSTKPMNKVHFYVARDKNGELWLYMGRTIRHESDFVSCWEEGGKRMGHGSKLRMYGLNENDYKDLKWEDEPLEVFVNMED